MTGDGSQTVPFDRNRIRLRLGELAQDRSSSIADVHFEADALLCYALRALGYDDIVEAWAEVPKRYE